MQLLYFRSFLSATPSADSNKKSKGPKQQPIPSASSIRPLLVKASGLLQEVGTPAAGHHASTCCVACVCFLAMQVCQAGCGHIGLVVQLQAALEPPFLLRHRVTLVKWKPVLDALEDVVLQTSAMESVLEGQGNWLNILMICISLLTLKSPGSWQTCCPILEAAPKSGDDMHSSTQKVILCSTCSLLVTVCAC